MEIYFRTKRLAALGTEHKTAVKKLGAPNARRLAQRLQELEAAETLDELRNLPGPRCHELTGDRKGQLSVDLDHPFRLIFKPAEEPPPRKVDGGLDWRRVTSVIVVGIDDTH